MLNDPEKMRITAEELQLIPDDTYVPDNTQIRDKAETVDRMMQDTGEFVEVVDYTMECLRFLQEPHRTLLSQESISPNTARIAQESLQPVYRSMGLRKVEFCTETYRNRLAVEGIFSDTWKAIKDAFFFILDMVNNFLKAVLEFISVTEKSVEAAEKKAKTTRKETTTKIARAAIAKSINKGEGAKPSKSTIKEVTDSIREAVSSTTGEPGNIGDAIDNIPDINQAMDEKLVQTVSQEVDADLCKNPLVFTSAHMANILFPILDTPTLDIKAVVKPEERIKSLIKKEWTIKADYIVSAMESLVSMMSAISAQAGHLNCDSVKRIYEDHIDTRNVFGLLDIKDNKATAIIGNCLGLDGYRDLPFAISSKDAYDDAMKYKKVFPQASHEMQANTYFAVVNTGYNFDDIVNGAKAAKVIKIETGLGPLAAKKRAEFAKGVKFSLPEPEDLKDLTEASKTVKQYKDRLKPIEDDIKELRATAKAFFDKPDTGEPEYDKAIHLAGRILIDYSNTINTLSKATYQDCKNLIMMVLTVAGCGERLNQKGSGYTLAKA